MWLITNFGFFSVVQKPDDPKLGTLTVRSRVLEDLESLKEQYFKQTMGEIQVNAGTDYKYRAKVPREAMAGAMSQIIMDLNYSNFKNSVAENQSYERASVYSKLWETLYKLQDSDEIESDDSLNTSQEKQSYGGILINKNGEILLRKPTGEFDGYVWTFPKGKNEPGMTPEETALEEVLQETGYRASIISKIPGKFKGGTGVTEYYLMKHSGKPEPFDLKETESIKWVSREEAFKLISLTKNEKGKKRDLQVLEAGTKTYDGFKKKTLFRCYEKITEFYPNPEPFESVDLIESYRQYWRPDKVRVLLLAESHVYTSQIDQSFTTQKIEGLANYPDRYARFVYCLAYGENSLIVDNSFKPKGGTPQFWKLFFSCINQVKNNESFTPILGKTSNNQRILNKIELLNKLRDRGIWLMDTSIVALYNKGTKPKSKVIDKSLKFSWEGYTRPILEDVSPHHIIVIGKRVAGNIQNDLKSMDIPFNVFEQPGAHLSSEKHLRNYQNYFRICKEHL